MKKTLFYGTAAIMLVSMMLLAGCEQVDEVIESLERVIDFLRFFSF